MTLEEQNKLYTKEGINPSAGCLSSFLTIFLLFPVFFVVLRPLTYILRIPADQINEAKGLLTQWLVSQNLYENVEKAEKFVNARPELLLLQHAKEHPAIFDSVPGFVDKLKGFDNSFLGFDLALLGEFLHFCCLEDIDLAIVTGDQVPECSGCGECASSTLVDTENFCGTIHGADTILFQHYSCFPPFLLFVPLLQKLIL